MQMPPEMLTAMKAQIVDPVRKWKVQSVNTHLHTEQEVQNVGGVPTSVPVTHRLATITLQSARMGKAIILMLEGGESGPFAKGAANFNGTTFFFTDAQLLNWCHNVETAFGPIAVQQIMQSFFGPIPSEE